MNRCYRLIVQPDDNDQERTTVTIERDALLGLLDRTIAEPLPLAHTVSRAQLRSRAMTLDESAGQRERPHEAPWDESLDTDITPSLSPMLVAAILLLLTVAFLAAAHAR